MISDVSPVSVLYDNLKRSTTFVIYIYGWSDTGEGKTFSFQYHEHVSLKRCVFRLNFYWSKITHNYHRNISHRRTRTSSHQSNYVRVDLVCDNRRIKNMGKGEWTLVCEGKQHRIDPCSFTVIDVHLYWKHLTVFGRSYPTEPRDQRLYSK